MFQIGPAKYGVRTPEGDLDWARVEEWGRHQQVRAFEVKLSQGAKPGKGGILPAAKVTPEIAAIRGIPAGLPRIRRTGSRSYPTCVAWSISSSG